MSNNHTIPISLGHRVAVHGWVQLTSTGSFECLDGQYGEFLYSVKSQGPGRLVRIKLDCGVDVTASRKQCVRLSKKAHSDARDYTACVQAEMKRQYPGKNKP